MFMKAAARLVFGPEDKVGRRRGVGGPLLSFVCIFAIGFGGAHANQVSGTVLDDLSSNPVSGALVTLQASGIRTVTATDGTFTLSTGAGTGLVIVGAHKGYYNESATVDTPATGVEIRLEVVPVGHNTNYQMQTPQDCGSCHEDQLEQWLTAPMAKAGTNTWVHDIYSGTGTADGMGGFVYLRDSKFATTNPASECASCHQPESWIENPFTALQDPLLAPSPEVMHGISCEVCHKVADVDVTKINFPGIFDGAVDFNRPDDPLAHPAQYGVLGDVDANLSVGGLGMRASYNPQLVAETCATCHQDAADPDENHSYTGVISEPTYLEWLASPYGDPESEQYASCVECHMPPSGEEHINSYYYPPLLRDPEKVKTHAIEGTTPRFLENAVEMSVESRIEGAELRVDVDIVNSLTGHHVPTGVTVRNMILLVEAWRAEDAQALTSTGTQTVHDLGGIGDPAQGYYAGLPGKYFAKLNHDEDGNGPTFFTDATGIQFDNRIPALATDSTSYSFALPAGAGALQVRARLIYRRAFRALVDAKQWTEDGHGNPLEDLAAPHFGHLMEQAEATVAYSNLELAKTVAPDGVQLSWPVSSILKVETSPMLENPWSWLAGSVTEDGGFNRMTVSPLADRQFFRLRAHLPLVIIEQPQSQTAEYGANVTFSVVATGSGALSYQWRLNGVDIAGATGTTHTLVNVDWAGVRNFSVVVTDDFASLTSSDASLTLE